MASKGKPKFSIGQRVFSKMHGCPVFVRKIVWDRDHSLWGYFFHGRPMYWLEYNLRPLTAREAGPNVKPLARGKRSGK